jgi:hypothetical protein
MKLRQGFVSNSSSSSFYIASKNPLTEQLFLNALGVPDTSVLFPLAKEISKFFVRKADFVDPITDAEDVEYWPKKIHDLFKSQDGFKFYHGYAHDDSDDVEKTVCSLNLDFKSDNLVIYKESYY